MTNKRGISRREMLATSGAAVSLLGTGPAGDAAALAQAPKPDTAALSPLNRFPTAVQDYFMARLREFDEERQGKLKAITTKSQAEAYVREVRERIRKIFGPLPAKTPLNPKVTGVLERDAYKIEKVIFESRPGFLVTANLYIPKGRNLPLPGVVGSCGHSDEGKAGDTYQAFSQGLARQGYVVLIFDPIGQGERLQYVTPDSKPRNGIGVREHLLAGNQQFLVGEFFGTWRAWDGIRAVDYLLTRPEVDPRHIGITGNSGGGTMSTWLWPLEDRWTMAAIGCFVTSFRRNLENELPADTEQCPPKVLALGLDHEDFLAAMAPKPVIILAKEKDFFDVRGSEEAYQRLTRLYELLGARQNIGLSVGPTGHGYSQESREAMYRWFNRATRLSQSEKEPNLTLEKPEELACTPRGQVAALDSRSLFSFTRDRSRELAGKRRSLRNDELKRVLFDSLRMPRPVAVPEYRILRPIRERGYPKRFFTTYALETEPRNQMIVYRLSDETHLSRPPQGEEAAILYAAHQSADQELRNEPLVRQLLGEQPRLPFFACDLRGSGESRPNTCGEDTYLQPYGNDYFYAIHSIMLDRPYVGQRTYDLLCTLEWLKKYGCTRVHLAAKGWGTIPATFAALLSDIVVEVTLKNGLASYASIAESEDYSWPLSSFLDGVLERFDLPDCYQALAAKSLRRLD